MDIDPLADRQMAHLRQGNRHDGFLHFLARVMRPVLLRLGRPLFRLALDLTIKGTEHLPPRGEAVLVIANHFGWYDAMLITLFLPFQPVFLVATESQRKWYVRLFMYMFDGIPVWRGQVDRNAFHRAEDALRRGCSVGIFPEGGINPDLAARVARGETIAQLRGNTARVSGELAGGKPGAALLATSSGVRILPVAMFGSELIGANIRRLRRTKVEVHIGALFGPFRIDDALSRHEKRIEVDRLADLFMRRIAVMFPPEKRGPYRDETSTSVAVSSDESANFNSRT
jgi:1-acyl-sn-glycerol-3-phosphate acyltransferase